MTEFVAIDIGTSFTKGGIVDSESGRIRDVIRSSAASRLANTNPQFHEVDAQLVLSGVRELVEALLKKSPLCEGILICGQMGGLVLCDDQSKPVRPYISWLDKRTAMTDDKQPSLFEKLTNILGDRCRTILGNEVRPGLPLSTLFWLQENGELQKYRDVYPVSLPDFVASGLCGTKPVMEWTNTPGLLDLTTHELAVLLLEELGVTNLQWPEIVDFRHCVGEFTVDGRSVPVFAAVGDHQCSLAGTLLLPEELSINVSTGSQVSILTADQMVGDFQLRSYFDGMMLRTVTNIPAGRALTSIVKLLSEMRGNTSPTAEDWHYFFEQAETVASSDIRASLAFFPGAVAGTGSFGNLREENMTVGHIARAALEQMAETYLQISARLAASEQWSRLALSGGVVQKSTLLSTLITKKFNAPSRLATSSEDALAGLMILGRVIAGMEDKVVEASKNVLSIDG